VSSAVAVGRQREIVDTGAEYSAALRVLVVGDEPLFRWAVGETLRAAGYAVFEAVVSEAGAFARSPADVVVIGPAVSTPIQVDLVGELHRSSADTAVVVIAGDPSRDALTALRCAGAARVVPEPVDIADLPALVATACCRRPI